MVVIPRYGSCKELNSDRLLIQARVDTLGLPSNISFILFHESGFRSFERGKYHDITGLSKFTRTCIITQAKEGGLRGTKGILLAGVEDRLL